MLEIGYIKYGTSCIGPDELKGKVGAMPNLEVTRRKHAIHANKKNGDHKIQKHDGRPSDFKTSGSSRSACSICLSAGKYLLLVAVIPAILNVGALHKEERELELPGQKYDIGLGQKLYMHCIGNGLPTVILDAPTGMSSDVWSLVQERLAKTSRVCIYDRAGLGFSDKPPLVNTSDPLDAQYLWMSGKESTTERMVHDLHQLIVVAEPQPKPLLLIGSELGAVNVQFYTQLYPRDVAGLVLLDPIEESLFLEDGGAWNHFWMGHMIPSFQALHVCAMIGLNRLALLFGLMKHPVSGPDVSHDIVARQKHLMCHPRHMSSVVEEHYFVNESLKQLNYALNMRPFPSNITVTVITGNYYDELLPANLNKVWAKSQQQLMTSVHQGSRHIVLNGADRHMLYRQPNSLAEALGRIVVRWKAENKRNGAVIE